MNIAEKIIVNGNVKREVKYDLADFLISFKNNNPGKNIEHARKAVETTLRNDYGFDLASLDIELSESINFIKLEVNKKSDKIA